MMRNLALLSLVLVSLVGCATQAVDRLDPAPNAQDDAGATNPNLGGQKPNSKPSETPATSTVFYAHTDKELFIVDPTKSDLPMQSAGLFDCVGTGKQAKSITDLAVDKTGKIYLVATPASGKKSIAFLDVKIAGGAVQCAGKGVSLNTEATLMGATFAPEGTVLPSAEALVVADVSGSLYQVDTNSADTTLLGNFGIVPAADAQGNAYENKGTKFQISGDIVFMAGNGTPLGFATVRDCPPSGSGSCNRTDTLVEIDMSKLRAGNTGSVVKKVSGQVLKAASCADTNESYGSMFGIAAFGDQIFGFARTTVNKKAVAQVVRIDNSTGSACLVADQSALTNAGFSGAGVTTSVQVSVPVK